VGPRARLDGCGKCPPPGLFFCILLYSVCTCVFVLIVLHFGFSLVLTIHNTNIHASGGFRTRNSSKRSAADLRLKKDRSATRIGTRSSDRPARSELVYRLSSCGPHYCAFYLYFCVHVELCVKTAVETENMLEDKICATFRIMSLLLSVCTQSRVNVVIKSALQSAVSTV
jgi:hypothetical protein